MPSFLSTRVRHHNPPLLALRPFRCSRPSATAAPAPAPTHEGVAHIILQQRSPAGALRIFRWASQLPSFRHDASTYRALVRALVSFRRFDAARDVLAEIPAATGRPPDEDTFVAIVRGLGRAGKGLEAVKVADLAASPRFGLERPSLKVFNSILNVLVGESIDLARDFYREKMMGCGVRGDEYTFGILMKGLCRTNRIGEGFKLLTLMKGSGIPPNPVVYNTLIHALCRNGKVGRARSLMSEMDCPSAVTFNILISAYCGEGNLVQALVMLEKCFDLRLVPDVVAVTKIVEVLCNEGRCMEAVEVLERAEEKGGGVDVVAYNTLIDGFCRQGKPSVGQRVVKEMESKGCLPNVHTYNALLSGFCAVKKMDSATDVFREMEQDGVSPDFESFQTIIKGFCSTGRVEDGLKFLGMMEEQIGQCGRMLGIYNSIIHGLYRENRLDEAHEFLENVGETFPRVVDGSKKVFVLCQEGLLQEAMKVYEEMVGEGSIPCVLVYLCLIDELSRAGSVREAFNLMNEMVGRGYIPMVPTFNSLISGFCMEGKCMSAEKLLSEMVSRGCSLDSASYSPLIEALCRQGILQKAFDLLVEMVGKGINPDCAIWESLVLCLTQETPWVRNNKQVVHSSMSEMISARVDQMFDAPAMDASKVC
ncbi:hypothetical protein Taro_019093 [Colocasia esculenta]|uniref:Pentatricopeptide repeat-containing protein n=1 Tax=Colocasia esculenta TaxID=4460 RepID=A0A843UK92_COLES|nr:hypothetical protein [Colocasia esculenta]